MIASASKVPSISASPDISKLVASTSPATVKTPLATVIKSVSPVWPIVVPLIITLSTVSVVNVPKLVIFDCADPVTVAAVPLTLPVISPVKGPAKASAVTVPSKYASLNSNEDVPKSIWLLVTGYNAEAVNVNLAALSTLKSISFVVPKSIAVWESSPNIKSVA